MTELAVKETAMVSAVSAQAGLPSGIDINDVEFGRLQLQQKTSNLVDNDKAKPGDIWDSLESKVVGSESLELRIIPLYVNKLWSSFWDLGKDKEYRFTVQFGPENAHWKFRDTVDGKPVINDLIYMWTVLPVYNGAASALPYRLKFRGMSRDIGKKLNTLVVQAAFKGLPTYGTLIGVTSLKQQNDKGSYHIYQVKAIEKNTIGLEAAEFWTNATVTKPVTTEGHIEEGEEVPF